MWCAAFLSAHYRPESDSAGPSWLTFLGHLKDSLWSCDLFRCESATLRTDWVLVVMDQFTRRIIGFGVHCGTVDGVTLCGMFRGAIRGKSLPKYLSSDHDPLYRFHQWKANLRILDVTEIKAVPYLPLSHPFVERLIGTLRREYLDRILFWSTVDLAEKLTAFQHYYNGIERMPDWKDACQNRVPTGRHHPSTSNPIGGGGIVEGCIRLQSPHDS
jgi:hypothetical protein